MSAGERGEDGQEPSRTFLLRPRILCESFLQLWPSVRRLDARLVRQAALQRRAGTARARGARSARTDRGKTHRRTVAGCSACFARRDAMENMRSSS